MTDRFTVGQRVRLVKGSWIGTEATILTPRETCWLDPIYSYDRDIFAYTLDIEGVGPMAPDGVQYGAPEDWLVPIYDGYEKTTWEELAPYWKPKEYAHQD